MMLRICCLVVLMPVIGGCGQNVTAVTGTDMPFTLYGLLSPDLDTQKALVYPIDEVLRPRGAEPIDAAVRSLDLTTGEEHFWTDSLVVDAGGAYEHLFQAAFRAEFGHAYRLTVARSDGAFTEVETTVPPRTEVKTGPATVFPGIVVLPAIVEGEAPRLLKILVTYYVTFLTVTGGQFQLGVPFDYSGEQERTSDGWQIRIDLAGDYESVERAAVTHVMAALNREFGIRIDRIRLQLIVASEEWDPPDGIFDPEVIVQPGTMSNVENGYGFLAAGYRHDRDLEVPGPDVLEAAGFSSGR